MAQSLKAFIALFIFVALTGTCQADQMQLPVTVTYRERIALPPDAVLELKLLDVSRADAPAIMISEMSVPIGGVPFDTSLSYEQGEIDTRMTYVVAATISSGDRVLFRTTSANPVLTRDAPSRADLVLRQAPRSSSDDAPPALAGVEWAAYEIGGRALISDDPPSIAFDTSGKFSLFGGCNRFVGTAEVTDGVVAFPKVIAGTQRACGPERDKLERDILAALTGSTRFHRESDIVAFQNEAGVVTARFRSRPH